MTGLDHVTLQPEDEVREGQDSRQFDAIYEYVACVPSLPDLASDDEDEDNGMTDEEDGMADEDYGTAKEREGLARETRRTPGTNMPQEEAMSFVAGYVAAKCRSSDPTLGTKTSITTGAQRAEVPSAWTCALSRGNLSLPSAEWFQAVKDLKPLFDKVMGPRFR